ncbi:M1 family metallopeptidase [Pasteuria penetrans]|uniref:M1 family metallopeptidase n=1 Tax=Pasteuria penetrans TaxID=86005 RepID=UPI000F947295|nr:M1 family metallopeptidase [Pasteuria penetrans]
MKKWFWWAGMIGILLDPGCYFDSHAYTSRVFENRGDHSSRPVYQISATYSPQQRDVTGHMRVEIPSDLPEAKGEEVFFRLYPNAFHHNWAVDKESHPEKPGFLSVQNVKVNGQEVSAKLWRDETVMKVDLPRRAVGTALTLDMDYHLRIPQGGLQQLKQNGNTALLAQWYPMLAVRDQEGWHVDPYPYISTGFPFYTRVADFYVSFYVPQG